MNVLKLTLNKKWFLMILSGEKREEYREIKKHWCSRFIHKEFACNSLNAKDIESHLFACPKGVFKRFNYIEFTNGYNPNSPKILIEFNRFEVRTGNKDWGAIENEIYFVLKLGKIESTQNI